MGNKTEFEESVRKFGSGGALRGCGQRPVDQGVRATGHARWWHRPRERLFVEFGLPQTTMKC